MKKENQKYRPNLYSRQSLCISLGQVQFIFLNVQLFHFIRCINRNYILQNKKNVKLTIIHKSLLNPAIKTLVNIYHSLKYI